MKKYVYQFEKYINQFKRSEKKVKPPQTKKISVKKANSLMVGFLFFIVGLVLMGTIRMFTSVGTINNLKEEITQLQQASLTKEKKDGQLDLPLIERLMNEFIPLYINVDFKEEASERIEILNDYVAFDASIFNEGLSQNLSRNLISFELLSVRSYERYALASYHVVYELFDEQLNEMEEEIESKEVTTVINIPFIYFQGLVSIISEPYFTAMTPILGQTEPFEMMEGDTSEAMAIERTLIEDYLPTFFDKYAESNETDLSLLMQDVTLMGGNFELETVNLPQARYAFVGEHVLVQVSVTFRDKAAHFVHTQPFTLLLEKQANSWFVLEMHHLFIN